LKTIIAGSRDITDYTVVLSAILSSEFKITEVVAGGARGVDRLAEQFAADMKLPIVIFPADWTSNPRAAGMVRNKQMAEYADALIAVWDGKSRGTKNMIDEAVSRNLKLFFHKI
jgi:hypothetical protein